MAKIKKKIKKIKIDADKCNGCRGCEISLLLLSRYTKVQRG